MAVTFVDANCSDIAAFVTNADPTVVVPGTTPSGALLVLGIRDSTDETTTITSIEDNVNGTWSGGLISGPSDATGAPVQRTWFYYRENSGTGTITITVHFSGAITGALIAGFAEGVATSSALDAADATPAEVTVAGTNHDSDTLVASAAGALIGFLMVNQNVTITADGVGETNVSGQNGRLHFLLEPYATGGTYGLEATTSASAIGHFHLAAFLEPGGAPASKAHLQTTRRMMGLT